MFDRRDVDHSQADPTRPSAPEPLGPVDEIVGQRDDLAGMFEHRSGSRTQHASATVGLEQRHADPPLEFAQPLTQRRRADPHPIGSDRPRRGIGDGNEVFELAQ